MQAVLAKPALSSDLTTRSTGNDAAVLTLKNSLSYSDDGTATATLSPSTSASAAASCRTAPSFQRMLERTFPTDLAQIQKRLGQFFQAADVATGKNGSRNLDKRLDELVPDAVQRAKVIADDVTQKLNAHFGLVYKLPSSG